MIGLAKKRKRLTKQIYPKTIQRDYARELLRVVEIVKEEIAGLLNDLPKMMEVAANELRQDAGEGKKVQDLVNAAIARIGARLSTPQLETLGKRYATQISSYQKIQLKKQVEQTFGVDVFAGDRNLQAMMDGFVSENVGLIRDMPRKILGGVEGVILRGVTGGKLHGQIAEDLNKQFRIGETRAKLIARDQVGKFYGQLNASRQKALGVERFVWETVRDNRVRPEHRDRQGKIFSWDDPPSDGLPGEPINCRCFATPIFDELLGEVSL